MTKLAKATGARMVTNLDDLSSEDLGYAKLVEERKVEEDKWTFIEGCKNPKAVTILVRGGTQRIVDEAERALHDALMVTKDVVEKPAVVGRRRSPRSRSLNAAEDLGSEALRQGAAGSAEVRRRDGLDTHDPGGERRDGPNRHPGRPESQARRERTGSGSVSTRSTERWPTCMPRTWSSHWL